MTVFENGRLVKEYSFEEVRERAELPLVRQRQQQQVRGVSTATIADQP